MSSERLDWSQPCSPNWPRGLSLSCCAEMDGSPELDGLMVDGDRKWWRGGTTSTTVWNCGEKCVVLRNEELQSGIESGRWDMRGRKGKKETKKGMRNDQLWNRASIAWSLISSSNIAVFVVIITVEWSGKSCLSSKRESELKPNMHIPWTEPLSRSCIPREPSPSTAEGHARADSPSYCLNRALALCWRPWHWQALCGGRSRGNSI